MILLRLQLRTRLVYFNWSISSLLISQLSRPQDLLYFRTRTSQTVVARDDRPHNLHRLETFENLLHFHSNEHILLGRSFLKDLWSVYLWTYPWVEVRFVLCATFPSKLVCCLVPMARIRQKACLDQVKCKFYRLRAGYDTIQNVKSATKIPNKLARR